jgi:peroxiredoxin
MSTRFSALLSIPFAIFFIATNVHSTPAVPTIGQKAPDFTAKDVSGKTVSLSDFKGKHVVLEWFNPNCPYVKKHYNSANMQGLQKEFTAKGVVWLAINSTDKEHVDYLSPAQLTSWGKEKAATPSTMLMDESGQIGQSYGAKTTPHMYIVNPQGQLVYAGGIDNKPSARAEDTKTATNYVRQALGEALAGKAITQAATQPYGCTVKYKLGA